MSAFERPKGSGQWVAKYQLAGKQCWVEGGPWSTKTQARDAERRDREARERLRTEETCAGFATRWLEVWPRPSESTQRNYATAIRHFADYFGSTPLGQVGRLEARTWALSVPRSVSRVAGIALGDAYNAGLIDGNPFANLRLPATERTEQIIAPTMEEYKALLDSCTVLGGYGAEFRALIQFAAWTGMRSGEIQALRWEDVGTDTILVRGARKRDGSIGPPKNGKAREISFLPPARVLDAVPRRPDPFVFHSARGGPLVQGSLHYAWREVRAASGIPAARKEAGKGGLRFHDLRHFCATQLLELGIAHFDVSVQLGHEDNGALVMQRYGHPSADAARERLLQAFEIDPAATGSPTGSRKAANG